MSGYSVNRLSNYKAEVYSATQRRLITNRGSKINYRRGLSGIERTGLIQQAARKLPF
jgi:hypothetical protein